MKTNKQRWQTILAAVRQTQMKELICSEISDEMLTQFAESILAEREPTDELAPIGQHMRHCLDCAQQLTDVTAALQLAALEEEVTPPLPTRPFDLTFLQPLAQGDTLPERVLAAFTRGARWMQDQHGNLWVNLAAAGELPSTPQYASVTKGAPKVSSQYCGGEGINK
jgi:hypothetical protein